MNKKVARIILENIGAIAFGCGIGGLYIFSERKDIVMVGALSSLGAEVGFMAKFLTFCALYRIALLIIGVVCLVVSIIWKTQLKSQE